MSCTVMSQFLLFLSYSFSNLNQAPLSLSQSQFVPSYPPPITELVSSFWQAWTSEGGDVPHTNKEFLKYVSHGGALDASTFKFWKQ